MWDRNMAEISITCLELTSGTMSVHKFAKGENAEGGENPRQHQSHKAESCWKGSKREGVRSQQKPEEVQAREAKRTKY